MKKVLIASVGGSPEPIVNAIVHAQPDFVYFLCSTGKVGSDETVEKVIVPGVQLAEAMFAIERVQSPHDLRDVVAACARIEADLEARFSGEVLDVAVNYTGGTRTMSAGLVSLAQRRGWAAEWTERPARPWSGLLTKVTLTAVTVFSSLELSCSPDINVIIGENGTGKTHLLKCMYALLRAREDGDPMVPVARRGDKLERVLMGRSRSWFAEEGDPSVIRIDCEHARFERSQRTDEPASWSVTPAAPFTARALYLPSREVLTMYPGFVAAYEKRELSLDETFYDLCKELSQRSLHEAAKELERVREDLEAIIGGKVRMEFDSFVVDTRRGTIPASMVAEGHRKLATLAYLIENGALTAESILFWDEPEANLNPRLITLVARVLRALARAGVQIFVATHDDLLARELSMAAEYKSEPGKEPLFFALHRASDDAPVEVESQSRWGDLQHNAIVAAYAAHYDHEQELFARASEEAQP